MYLGIGTSGSPASQLYRSDDVSGGVPVFTLLSNPSPASPGYGAHNYCGGQCWYDNFVHSPAGHPDIVYLLGSYQYGETGRISNGRGVVLSTDAGATFTDMTMDAPTRCTRTGSIPISTSWWSTRPTRCRSSRHRTAA